MKHQPRTLTLDEVAALSADELVALRRQAVYPPMAGGDELLEAEPLTLDQLRERQTQVQARLDLIHTDSAGRHMTDPEREEWESLGAEYRANEDLIAELDARERTLQNLAQAPDHRERAFHTSADRRGPEDIYDLVAMRSRARNVHDEQRMLIDGARRSIESSEFPEEVGNDPAREHVLRMMNRFGEDPEPDVGVSRQAMFARHILETGGPLYRRAFLRYLAGRGMSSEEERALNLGTGSQGGFAVVYTLDPTIIPTSNLSVNPYRAISRNESIIGTNEWRGVTSAGVTAAYAGELVEVADGTPTLAQPAAIVEKAHTFVPFSIELGQDWGALQSEMAVLIQDAKDDLEATKFTTGAGHGSLEPQGILTGATTVVTAAGTASFAVADLYKVWEALGPRFRPRAQWGGNLTTYDRIRQFDTQGGASIFVENLQLGFENQTPTPGNMGARLLGRPANEISAMSTVMSGNAKMLIVGDWRYFVVVDRVGLDVEVIPHLFGASGRPIGERGIYAYWRNTSRVLDANAFRVLIGG